MISLRTRTFVHGNAVFLQLPGGAGLVFTVGSSMANVANHAWTDIVGERQGPGVVFRGNAGNMNFFHVSIPSSSTMPIFSPQLITGGDPPEPSHNYFSAPLSLISVFFDVTVDSGVSIEQVFAFDGRALIPGFPRPPGALLPSATVLPLSSGHSINAGLGLSFQVAFASQGNITFHSAGAEFLLAGLP
jgi:hypothetical protein